MPKYITHADVWDGQKIIPAGSTIEIAPEDHKTLLSPHFIPHPDDPSALKAVNDARRKAGMPEHASAKPAPQVEALNPNDRDDLKKLTETGAKVLEKPKAPPEK